MAELSVRQQLVEWPSGIVHRRQAVRDLDQRVADGHSHICTFVRPLGDLDARAHRHSDCRIRF